MIGDDEAPVAATTPEIPTTIYITTCPICEKDVESNPTDLDNVSRCSCGYTSLSTFGGVFNPPYRADVSYLRHNPNAVVRTAEDHKAIQEAAAAEAAAKEEESEVSEGGTSTRRNRRGGS